jgi:hypothetical protein
MEKTSDGSFARITRKTAEDDDDDEDEKDWGMALNRYIRAALLTAFPFCAWRYFWALGPACPARASLRMREKRKDGSPPWGRVLPAAILRNRSTPS